GGFGGFGGYQQQSREETQEDAYLRAAANYINSGHYREALNVLDQIQERSARWYYFSAAANSGAGNNVAALEHAKKALQMDRGTLNIRHWCSGWKRAEAGIGGCRIRMAVVL
ncbi:MAG TPA: hypothetical protein DCZ20_11385, partial [Lachnospiraceae bacterium]|nr:hypothetical protein [Lachnospiraceae bacterium]